MKKFKNELIDLIKSGIKEKDIENEAIKIQPNLVKDINENSNLRTILKKNYI